MKYFLVFFTVACFFGSCTKDESTGQLTDKTILGIWINPEYNTDGTLTANRADAFQDNAAGFEFKENGDYIERANSGWCGTPPISYTNYEGFWEEESEDNYLIDVAYWGGRQNYNIEVVSVNSDEIVYKKMY